MCAIAGVSPDCDLDVDIVAAMAIAKQTEAWDHTSSIMSTISSVFGNKSSPEDFHPMSNIRKNKSKVKSSKSSIIDYLQKVIKE